MRLKCTLVGDEGVGKSSLLKIYTNSKKEIDRNDYQPTQHFEKYATKVTQKGRELDIEFWDINGSGKEKYV